MDVIPRLFSAPQRHFFLYGPHGSGKTTWCARAFPDAVRIDLLDPSVFSPLNTRPELLARMIDADPAASPPGAPGTTIVIDEIQKVPGLLATVQRMIERGARRQFVFTLSSAMGLRHPGIDLLSAHAVRCQLHPYMAVELGEHFLLDSALRRGMLPAAWATRDAKSVLHACNQFYVYEELKMERRVRDTNDFIRFLEVMSLRQAALLDLSAVARECRTERQIIDVYMDILEDLLLCFRLPPFAKRTRRTPLSDPKFYFFDTGIYLATRPAVLLEMTHTVERAAMEGLVAQHLRAWCDYSEGEPHLYYWRDRAGNEVDFVVYAGSDLYAIDVITSRSLRPGDLHGLQAFAQEHPRSRRFLLYRGHQRLEHDDMTCLPCEDFLLELKPGYFPE